MGASPIAISIAGNNAGMSLIKAGAGAGIVLRLESAGTDESLRINHSGAGTAFGLEMTGNATAMLIHSTQNQACIQVHAEGNSAGIQVTQDNLLDAITTNGDMRAQQFIATLHIAIKNAGSLTFSEAASLTTYRDALTLSAGDALTLGNASRTWPTHIVTGAALFDVTVNSKTLLSMATTGVVTIAHSAAADLLVLTKSNVGGGNALTVTNHGTGIGCAISSDAAGRALTVTQSGDEDGVLITQSGGSTGLIVTQSHNTNRVAKFTKTGTGGNAAVDIANAGTGQGILLTQTGDAVALQVNPSSASVNAAIAITHGNVAGVDVSDLQGTASNWKITSKGNFVAERLSMTSGNYTIATGAITIAKAGLCLVDTEAGAGSDDLDTISSVSTDVVTDGQILVIMAKDDTHTVVVRHIGGGTGNIRLNGAASRTLDQNTDTLTLIYRQDLTLFCELSFSNNT